MITKGKRARACSALMAQEFLRNRAKDARCMHSKQQIYGSLATFTANSPAHSHPLYPPLSIAMLYLLTLLRFPDGSVMVFLFRNPHWRGLEKPGESIVKAQSFSTSVAPLLCILLQYIVVVYYVLFLPAHTTLFNKRTGLLENSTPSRVWNEARRRNVYHCVIIKAK